MNPPITTLSPVCTKARVVMLSKWSSDTLRAISPAGVQTVLSVIFAPDDHFTARPDCRVIGSSRWRVGGAGGCPVIRAGIVSPARVRNS